MAGQRRELYENETLEPPDPGEGGGKFLCWIKKRGFIFPYDKCDEYCLSIGLDLIEFARDMGRERIIIARRGGGEKAVKMVDRRWTAKWARRYGCDPPHHAQEQRAS